MCKFEDLTSETAEESPSRDKAKGKILKKGEESDDERASSEPFSELENQLEEQVRQRMKTQKIKINSSRAKTDERKECYIGSSSESKREYDDRVSLHADDDSELAGNLNNILVTNKESEDGDSDSGMKRLIKELGKYEEIAEKINKDLADIVNKAWENPNAFEKFKTKMKTCKKP